MTIYNCGKRDFDFGIVIFQLFFYGDVVHLTS